MDNKYQFSKYDFSSPLNEDFSSRYGTFSSQIDEVFKYELSGSLNSDLDLEHIIDLSKKFN